MRLYRINEDDFIINHRDEGRVYCGTRRKTIETLYDLGVCWDAIEDALVQLELEGHDIAEFGVYGGLVFTKKVTR